MIRSIELGILALLWTVTAWRMPALRHPGRHRALWVAFAGLACTMTLRVPKVAHAVDAALSVPEIATLLKHSLCAVAAGGLLEFIASITQPERSRRIMHRTTLLSLVALAGLFWMIPRTDPAPPRFFEGHADSPWAVVYLILFLAYLGTAMTTATLLFWSASRHTKALWLRAGLRLLATGTTIAAIYTAYRVGYTTFAWITGDIGHAGRQRATGINSLLAYSAIGFIVLGSSFPACGVAWRNLHAWRLHRQLRRLWEECTGAAPEVVLDARLPPGIRVKLQRRVVEIYDSARTFYPYATADIRCRARKVAEEAGLLGDELSDVAKAAWLQVARERKLADHHVLVDPRTPSNATLDQYDLTAAAERLRKFSAIYFSATALTVAAAVRHSKESVGRT